MATELTSIELFEVSLVDRGDDPLAKVAICKRKPEGNEMENQQDLEKGISIEIEIKSPEEELAEQRMEMEAEAQSGGMMKAAMCENCNDQNCQGCDGESEDMMDTEKECGKKVTRKSWKAEAETLEEVNKVLLEEVEILKAKVAELEAEKVEKSKPEVDMIEVEGEMIAKSAIPTAVLKKLEDMQKQQEMSDLRKRAVEILPNFRGTEEQRGKLLKSVDGLDTEDRNAILESLKAADALFANAFAEIGKADADGDFGSAEVKLEKMAKAYKAEHADKTYEQAYAEVVKTKEGKALLNQIYKK